MNFEPLIRGISEFIGAAGKVAEERAETKGTGRGVVRGGTAHAPTDVERWLGPLSAPEKQVPLIHDYLRGHAALKEAEATGVTHVREISVPVWRSAQGYLEQKVNADPEVQAALKNMFIGVNTPKDPDVTTVRVKPEPEPAAPQSIEVAPTTPTAPQAKPARALPSLEAVATKQRSDAWNEFAIGTEAQDAVRTDAALERIKALHEPETVGAKSGVVPEWQKALDYMAALEQQLQSWREAKVNNEQWTQNLQQFHEQQGIDTVPLPKYIRDTVERFEAWADAQKPGTLDDHIGQVLGVPRAVMSSADLSAPGRQGLLMISRPEYWKNLKPMVEAWSPEKYLESQAYLRSHPDFAVAQEAGLALTDIHSRLAPREEAFASQLAERLPVIGPVVKSSEQAYTTFLNRLRFDVFSNTLKEAAAAGVDVSDREFLRSLAEWVNTSTGRGGGKFNTGVLSTVMFSPRLALSRFQTFNPWYYYKMNPYVRQQAIKANLSAAAFVYGLVSLAALGGAKVVWDFRNPDAGKARIGNTRIDLGGGHFQFLRLFTQIVTNQKVNSETGKVTELGSKFGVPSRLDVMTQFLIGKEAPVASFVTDWLRGKDQSGKKFNLTDEVISRVTPLAMQDMYDVLKDKGVEGLIYAFPAIAGVGIQSYGAPQTTEVVPFIGVKGQVPPEHSAGYAKMIEDADKRATVLALAKTKNLGPLAAKSVLRSYIQAERLKARRAWIVANVEAFKKAKLSGQPTVPLVAPDTTGGQQ